MTEVNHIANTTELHEPRASLAAHLESLLGAALGGGDDPDQALRIMTAALQERTELPKLQRKAAELESALAAETARIPPLEAELAQCHRFEMMLARDSGKENRDEIIGYVVAATTTFKHVVPELNALCEEQAARLKKLEADYAEIEPIAVMITTALGRASSLEEMHKVTQEALEARAERQANKERMAEIEHEHALRELDVLLGKAHDECRLTKATEDRVRHGFASNSLTLEGAKFLLESLPVIEALKRRDPAAPVGTSPDAIKHNGKTWAELMPAQRADLHREDPELYRLMREQAMGTGN